MYKDYLDAIVRFYQYRKNESDFPPRLIDPSPGALRGECISVYKERPNQRDNQILRDFFGVPEGESFKRLIENAQVDKFRPLQRFLLGGSKTPDRKHLELLGWLLDFPGRPFERRVDYEKYQWSQDITDNANAQSKDAPDEIIKEGDKKKDEDRIGSVEINEPDTDEADFNEGEVDGINVNGIRGEGEIEKEEARKEPAADKRWKKPVMVLILVILVGAFAIYTTTFRSPFNVSDQQCMVWLSDHYEKISCDSVGRFEHVTRLDERALENQRRVTRQDTISRKDFSRFFYQKRQRDSLDVFTFPGEDPLRPGHYLRPLTLYMYIKYLEHKYLQAQLTMP